MHGNGGQTSTVWLNEVASLVTCDLVRHLARQDSRDPQVQRRLQPRRRRRRRQRHQLPLHRSLPKIDETQIWEGDILVICDSILYVKDNDVWISNEKTVDNILIKLISKLDIKFYGADGKRKYSYNI